ncbi:MAG: exodeoxyribonuclease VII large subunit [SAR202 cluster bacterium]|nr:exodeoxyribonuclease VII large subunit [SAR202 cluster bacterium]
MAVYSVAQVTSYLRDLLAMDSVLRDVWVRGEVGNLSRPGSGHCYFNLRDSGTMMRCAMFKRAGPQGSTAALLKEGAAVIVHGKVTMYEARGEVQIVVDIVQPEGVGELQLKLEQLKLKLQTEGLFEESRKRPFPQFPRRIGVITSPSGAVWHDIQTVIGRRYPLVELVLAPSPVQGDGCCPGVVDAFERLNEIDDIDLVILARGGGSLEDLWGFNEEEVARAIFSSRAPVISAIGHETDYTIADLVADRRAPTPSAAAEMAVPNRIELAQRVVAYRNAMTEYMTERVQSGRDEIDAMVPRMERFLPDFDALRIQIDDRLRLAAKTLHRDVAMKMDRVYNTKLRLESLSPKDTLRRGYAIVQKEPGSEVVSDASQVAAGDSVRVTVAAGGFGATVAAISQEG